MTTLKPFEKALQITPRLNLEHGFLKRIRHRLFKERGQRDTSERVKSEESSSNQTFTNKIPDASVKQPINQLKKPSKKDCSERRAKRPDRKVYIPPGRRTGSEDENLAKYYPRSASERLHHNSERKDCECTGAETRDTPTLNAIQGRAARSMYKKKRDDCSSLDTKSEYESSTTSSMFGAGDSQLAFRNPYDDTDENLTVHIEGVENNLGTRLDEMDIERFPDEIRQALQKAYKGAEVREEDLQRLANSLVDSAAHDRKYADTAAQLCSCIVQRESSKQTSARTSGSVCSFQDLVIGACLTYYYECRSKWWTLAIFCCSLMCRLSGQGRPGWRALPLLVLDIFQTLSRNSTTVPDDVTVLLMADVLCRSGKQLEAESSRHVEEIIFILRQVLLSKNTTGNLRRRILLALELKASGWTVDLDTVDYYKISFP